MVPDSAPAVVSSPPPPPPLPRLQITCLRTAWLEDLINVFNKTEVDLFFGPAPAVDRVRLAESFASAARLQIAPCGKVPATAKMKDLTLQLIKPLTSLGTSQQNKDLLTAESAAAPVVNMIAAVIGNGTTTVSGPQQGADCTCDCDGGSTPFDGTALAKVALISLRNVSAQLALGLTAPNSVSKAVSDDGSVQAAAVVVSVVGGADGITIGFDKPITAGASSGGFDPLPPDILKGAGLPAGTRNVSVQFYGFSQNLNAEIAAAVEKNRTLGAMTSLTIRVENDTLSVSNLTSGITFNQSLARGTTMRPSLWRLDAAACHSPRGTTKRERGLPRCTAC